MKILSFHPIITADKNMICAGRDPGETELVAIRQADAIILPQGCRETLYRMAADHCARVFPNYDAKFQYPGKTGQARLFKHLDLPAPRTETFGRLDEFFAHHPPPDVNFDYPFVFKFDWGGEGDTVIRVNNSGQFNRILEKTAESERTGQYGFLIQEYIETDNRSLRVAVIGEKQIAYWRGANDSEQFGTALSKGATLDADSDPDKQAAGIDLVNRLCEKTGINLAGIDLIFPNTSGPAQPLLLEINYFFGRTGLGGSEQYYRMLEEEVRKWINKLKYR